MVPIFHQTCVPSFVDTLLRNPDCLFSEVLVLIPDNICVDRWTFFSRGHVHQYHLIASYPFRSIWQEEPFRGKFQEVTCRSILVLRSKITTMARTVLEILQPLDADQAQVQEECQNQLKDGEGWPQHCSRILLRKQNTNQNTSIPLIYILISDTKKTSSAGRDKFIVHALCLHFLLKCICSEMQTETMIWTQRFSFCASC